MDYQVIFKDTFRADLEHIVRWVTSLIIPTDLFHTRRVRWLFRKQLRESAAGLQMDAITPKKYAVTNWWRHEEGLIAFQNEAVKSMFYRLKY